MTESKPSEKAPSGHAQNEERPQAPAAGAGKPPRQPPGEKGGPKGPEPTRYGDWEKGGRCFDF